MLLAITRKDNAAQMKLLPGGGFTVLKELVNPRTQAELVMFSKNLGEDDVDNWNQILKDIRTENGKA
jgi:hypothetical protein